MFGKDEAPEVRLKKEFWKALDESPFVMLGLEGVEDSRTRPMTAQIDHQDRDKEEGGPLYFFASKTDGVGADIAQGRRAVAAYSGKGHKLFAHIHGNLVPANDQAVIERLWNPIIASWYKDGKQDPDLLLLRFDTDRAQIWEADTGSTLKAAALKALFDIDPGADHSKEHQAEVAL